MKSLLLSSLVLFGVSMGEALASDDQGGLPELVVVETKKLMTPQQEAEVIQQMVDFYPPLIKQVKEEIAGLIGEGVKHLPTLEDYIRDVHGEPEVGFDLDEAIRIYRRDHKKVDEQSSLEDILDAFRHALICHYTLESEDDRLDKIMAHIVYNHATHEIGKVGDVVNTLRDQCMAGETTKDRILKERTRALEKAAEDTILRLVHKRAQVRKVREYRLYNQFLESMRDELRKELEAESK